MKKIIPFILVPLLSFSIILFAPVKISPATPPYFGIWIHGPDLQTREKADQTISRIVAAGFNNVTILVFYWGGYAYFYSNVADNHPDLDGDFDPVRYATQELHKKGVKVHARFVSGAIGESAAPDGKMADKIAANPDWLLQDSDGKIWSWYDLHNPEVRKFQIDMIVDFLQNYDVDGIQFDYIRFPVKNSGYNPWTIKTFTEITGMTLPSFDFLPVQIQANGNPVINPTTAEVLAQFDSGIPAVYLNHYGKGHVLGFNFQATNSRYPVFGEIITRYIKKYTPDIKTVFLLSEPETIRKYGSNFLKNTSDWFTRLGFTPEIIKPARISSLDSSGLLVLPSCYLLSKQSVAGLAQFIKKGGHGIFIDGPVLSMQNPALQVITGFAKKGSWFTGESVITPVKPHDLIPAGENNMSSVKQCLDAWLDFRKLGPTMLVSEVHKRVKSLRPEVEISACVFETLRKSEDVLQDWPEWLQKGLLDYCIPMAYGKNICAPIDDWEKISPDMKGIVAGLALFEGNDKVFRRPEKVKEQIIYARSRNVNNFCFFAGYLLTDPVIELFRTELFPRPEPEPEASVANQ